MMSSIGNQRETAVLECLVPNLEAEGFQVFLHPSRALLPPFMQPWRPDAIAVKPNEKIAIEVMAESPGGGVKREKLSALFSAHPEWQLRIIYAPPLTQDMPIKTPSKEVVIETLHRLPRIMEEAGPVPALLTAWAAFEAVARSLVPESLRKPQSPARLIEILASDGYITPNEADQMRGIGRQRSVAAHGDFDITFTPTDLGVVVEIIQILIKLSPWHGLEGSQDV
ncbi:MAG: hypothetical protein WCF85_07530 [Rhodospirillaceae bacterium]